MALVGSTGGEAEPRAHFGHTALQAGQKYVAAEVHGRGGWLAKMGVGERGKHFVWVLKCTKTSSR